VPPDELREEKDEQTAVHRGESAVAPPLKEHVSALPKKPDEAQKSEEDDGREEHAGFLYIELRWSKQRAVLRHRPERLCHEEERARSFCKPVKGERAGEEAHEAVDRSYFADTEEQCRSPKEAETDQERPQAAGKRLPMEGEVNRKSNQQGNNCKKNGDVPTAVQDESREQPEETAPCEEILLRFLLRREEQPEQKPEQRDAYVGNVPNDHMEKGEAVCDNDKCKKARPRTFHPEDMVRKPVPPVEASEEEGDDACLDCGPRIEYECQKLRERVVHGRIASIYRHSPAEMRGVAEGKQSLLQKMPPPAKQVTNGVPKVVPDLGVRCIQSPQKQGNQSEERKKPTHPPYAIILRGMVSPAQRASGRWVEPIVLMVMLAAFFLVKVFFLNITIGDQGVYHYAAKLWSQGLVPHRDFFLSHSPLHILLPTLVIGLTDLPLQFLDLLPSIIGLCSGALFFLVLRRAMGSRGALIGTFLFLFSYAHLIHSSHLTGVNTTLFFLLLGLLLNRLRRPVLCGAALGLSFLSGAYAAPAVLALFTAMFFEQRSIWMKAVVSFAAVSVLLHSFLFLVAGQPFIDQVYLYHLSKVEDSAFFVSKLSVLALVVQKDAVLTVLTVCGAAVFPFALSSWRRGSDHLPADALQLARLSLTALALYAVFFLIMRSIFSHYFLLTLPFAATLATVVVEEGQRRLGRAHAWPSLTVFLLLFVGLSMVEFHANRERKHFDNAQEIASFLSSSLTEKETLYGDFAIVPTLSLLSGRRIAANEIDSSIMRFTSQSADLQKVISAIEKDNVRLIVSRPHRGITVYPPFREYLTGEYALLKSFNEGTEKGVEVWRKK
jgi:hypothetical protein